MEDTNDLKAILGAPGWLVPSVAGHWLLRHDQEQQCLKSYTSPCGGDWGRHESCHWDGNCSNFITSSWEFPLWSPFSVLLQAQKDQEHPLLWQSLVPLDAISLSLLWGKVQSYSSKSIARNQRFSFICFSFRSHSHH